MAVGTTGRPGCVDAHRTHVVVGAGGSGLDGSGCGACAVTPTNHFKHPGTARGIAAVELKPDTPSAGPGVGARHIAAADHLRGVDHDLAAVLCVNCTKLALVAGVGGAAGLGRVDQIHCRVDRGRCRVGAVVCPRPSLAELAAAMGCGIAGGRGDQPRHPLECHARLDLFCLSIQSRQRPCGLEAEPRRRVFGGASAGLRLAAGCGYLERMATCAASIRYRFRCNATDVDCAVLRLLRVAHALAAHLLVRPGFYFAALVCRSLGRYRASSGFGLCVALANSAKNADGAGGVPSGVMRRCRRVDAQRGYRVRARRPGHKFAGARSAGGSIQPNCRSVRLGCCCPTCARTGDIQSRRL